jgi:hypothetical protein
MAQGFRPLQRFLGIPANSFQKIGIPLELGVFLKQVNQAHRLFLRLVTTAGCLAVSFQSISFSE